MLMADDDNEMTKPVLANPDTTNSTPVSNPIRDLLIKRVKDLRFSQYFGIGFGIAVAIVASPAVPSLGPGEGALLFLIWLVVMAGYVYSCQRKIVDTKRVLRSLPEHKP